MSTEYFVQEGALSLHGFVDASINTLVYPTPDGSIRLDVTRVPGVPGPLARAVDGVLTRERRELASFAAEPSVQRAVDGVDALETVVTFERDGAPAIARRVHFFAGTALMTIGVSGPVAARQAIDSLYERASSTVRFEPDFRPKYS